MISGYLEKEPSREIVRSMGTWQQTVNHLHNFHEIISLPVTFWTLYEYFIFLDLSDLESDIQLQLKMYNTGDSKLWEEQT